jgi:5-methyltetrahydropteroyltriglutamate--homocysteine methyltransferase
MKDHPLRTSVIGSYPFPGWLEFASQHLDAFGRSDVAEIQNDAVVAAVHDQVAAGLDVITDGEQTRLDFQSFVLRSPRRHRTGGRVAPEVWTAGA